MSNEIEQSINGAKIHAWVYKMQNTISFMYEVENKQYNLNVPLTKHNDNLEHGQKVTLSLMIEV